MFRYLKNEEDLETLLIFSSFIQVFTGSLKRIFVFASSSESSSEAKQRDGRIEYVIISYSAFWIRYSNAL